MRLIVVLGLLLIQANAQTNIAIPASSGAGIKLALPERPGINLDDSYDYGTNQLTANLVASQSLSFAPQVWAMTSTCKSGSTTQWIDQNQFNPQPANFWQTATYRVISGADIGNSGTVTSSAASSGSNGVAINATFTTGCSAGDVMLLACRTALGNCAGGYTNANDGNIYGGSGGTAAFETADVSPSSSSPQAIQLTAPGSNTSTMLSAWDAATSPIEGSHYFILMNGSYTLTFRAKGTAGAPTVQYEVFRLFNSDYLNGTVTPTVSATPGAGWTNYTFTFTESETSPASNGQLKFTVTGGTALIQDVALTEAPIGGNPTVFRNAVYQKLLALHPGTLRFSTNSQYGCTFDNMIQSHSGRSVCGSQQFQYGSPIPYGLNDFFTLAKAIGADPWWTFSVYSTPADMADIAAYMSGTCGNGNSYTTARCNYGQVTPWTSVFANIYLEMGNEVWNSGLDDYIPNDTAYGKILGTNAAAFKASSFYTSNMKLVGSGFIFQPNSGWNPDVLAGANSVTNGLPDFIDGAPYMFGTMTETSSNAAIFAPMFTEPVNFTQTGGLTNLLQTYTNITYPTVNGAVYETNLGTQCGLTGVSQATINGVAAGLGSGLDATLNMLLAARDAGIKVQNLFALPEVGNSFSTAASTSANCANNNALYTPLWGAAAIMPGPASTGTIDRPSGIAFGMVTQAIGSKLNILNTVQTSTPTYNQAAAQVVGGAATIAANSAVPLLQAFAFGDGTGSYGLIEYCLNLTTACSVTYSGAGAPTGTATVTTFGSANALTDNNESAVIGSTPTVVAPSSSSAACPTSLPAHSMTTCTYSVSAAAGGSTFTGVIQGASAQ